MSEMKSALDLYQRDAAFYRMVNSAVSHAMHECRNRIDPERPERAIYETATLACITALKRAFDGNAEITRLRAENEKFKELAINGLNVQAMPMFIADPAKP